MATKTITTVFAVGGEKEYKAAISAINAELAKLDAEMQLNERVFSEQDALLGNARGFELLTKSIAAQREKLDVYRERLESVRAGMERLNSYAETLSARLEALNKIMNENPDDSDEYKAAAKQYKETEAELDAVEMKMKQASQTASKLGENIAKTQLEMHTLEKRARETAANMDSFGDEAEEAAQDVDALGGESALAADGFDRIGEAVEYLARSDASMQVRRIFNELQEAMRECVEASIEWESAFAGVQKTVEGTPEQLAELSDGIRQLSLEIPETAANIAAVAEAAGQMGIATEDVFEFTRVMIELGVSTNLNATEAAEALAKIANVTKLDASDYEKLASVIVELGNNMATTEGDIISMATRLAATGELVGLTQTQLMAVAAALSSVGVEAEAGGSAISKLLRKLETAVAGYAPALAAIEKTGESVRDLELMQANASSAFKDTADAIGFTSTELSEYVSEVKLLNQIAETSGVSAEEFAEAWGQDAVRALDLFITGIGEIDEKGGSAVNTLSEIAGMSEVRLSNAILALASSGGLLTETLDMAEDAWRENAALANEAAVRFETTESKVTLLDNAVDKLKIAIGEDFTRAGTPILEWLTSFISDAAYAADVSPELSAELSGIGASVATLAGASTAAAGIRALSSALSLFGTTGGPVAVAVAALAGIGTAVYTYVKNADAITEEAQALVDANDALLASVQSTQIEFETSQRESDKSAKQIRALIDEISGLSDEMRENPNAADDMARGVEELNALLPELGLAVDAQTGTLNMSREALEAYAEETEEIAELQRLNAYIEELTSAQQELIERQLETSDAADAASEAYEREKGKLGEWTDGITAGQKILNYLNESFRDQKRATKEAGNSLSALAAENTELEKTLEDVTGRLEEATAEYEAMAAAMSDAEIEARERSDYNDLIRAAEDAYEARVSAAEKTAVEEYEIYKAGLAAELDALESSYDARENAIQRENKALLKEKQSAQKKELAVLEDALDAEMDALQAQYDAKIALINAEYAERMKLVDEERYNAIQQIEEEIAAIEAQTAAEEEAIREREQQDKISKLEQAVRDAETRAERKEAEEDLADYLNELERERILADREAQVEALEARKKLLNEEYDAKIAEIEAEQTVAVEAVQAEADAEKEALKAVHEERIELLEEQQDEELETYREYLSERLDALSESYAAEKEALETQHTELLELRQKEIDEKLAQEKAYAEESLEIATGAADEILSVTRRAIRDASSAVRDGETEIYRSADDIADALISGLTEGIDSRSREVQRSAEKVARLLSEKIADELDIHSPSRVARRMGEMFGEGLALGIEDKISAVEAAAARMSTAMVGSETLYATVGKMETDMYAEAAIVAPTMRSAVGLRDRVGTQEYGTQDSRGGDTFIFNVDAEKVKEFNDLVRMAETRRQDIRMGYTGG